MRSRCCEQQHTAAAAAAAAAAAVAAAVQACQRLSEWRSRCTAGAGAHANTVAVLHAVAALLQLNT
jgi:hypothetical protein